MYAAVYAALMAVLGWFLRKIVIAFIVLTAVYVLVEEFSQELLLLIGAHFGESLGPAFSVVGPGVWFFLNYFQISAGIPILISAYITRFLIRRLPVIG